MANNFKIVWLYNPADGNKKIGSKIVDLDYKLSDGETFVQPTDGLYEPIRFDLAAQTWTGATQQEWEAAHPDPAPTPTAQQKAMAGVLKDLASVKQDGQSQDQLNANLMKQVAQLSIADKAKDKVNAQLLKDVAGLKIQLGNLEDRVEEAKARVSVPADQPAQPSAVTNPTQPTVAVGSTQPTQPKED